MALTPNTVLPGTGQIYAATERTVGGALAKNQHVLINAFDGPSCDAFGRWRTSSPHALFDSKLLGGHKDAPQWDESLETGSGISSSTPTAAKPYIDFTSTDATAGKFTRQTRRYFNYQPGKSQLILVTGVLELASGTKTGCERRIGYFDDNNGVFFESDAGAIGVSVRSNDSGSPADTTVLQASWNLDTLDGDADASNPSGITADWTKAQIFVIDFQWLSVGRVRFGVELNGMLHYVHEVLTTNVAAIPWAATPNLPIRYQMITTSGSGVCTMRAICSTVISEGGVSLVGPIHSHGTTDHVNANVADSVYALLGLRLKTANLGASISLIAVSVLAETADSYEWRIYSNPTVAGTFAYSDKTNSGLQVATGDSANPSTNTITGGTVLARGFGETKSESTLNLEPMDGIGSQIDGTLDTIVLAVRPLGSNADIQGSLTWREIS